MRIRDGFHAPCDRRDNRRRAIQQKYNEEHHITPQTIRKKVSDLISISKDAAEDEKKFEKDPSLMTKKEFDRLMHKLEKQMRAAAAELNFEMAAEIRDKITELKKQMKDD
jgi:excinuclease ABC subunit B